MTVRTKQNLNTAMLQEAMAYAKYMRFAACARMNGNWDLAGLFQNTANADLQDHFRKEFDLAMSCSDDVANLKTSIQDKASQIDMYSRFAMQARADGDIDAAELFDCIHTEILRELAAFEAELEQIKRVAAKECKEAV